MLQLLKDKFNDWELKSRAFNPCKDKSQGKWWADVIYKVYSFLNYGAEECSCCSFFRGAMIGALIIYIL